MASHTRRPIAPRTRRFRLQRLEDRLAPAVVTSFDRLTGALTISCDGPDAIVLSGGAARDPYMKVNDATVVDSTGAPVLSVAVSSMQISGSNDPNLIDCSRLSSVSGLDGLTRVNLINRSAPDAPGVTLFPVTIDGGGGDDVIFGSPFDDQITGGSGKDTIKGGRGDDLLVVGGEDEDCDGGAGDDEVEFLLPSGGGVPVSLVTELTPDGSMLVTALGVTRALFDVETLTPVAPTNDPTFKAITTITGDALPSFHWKVDFDRIVLGGPVGGQGGGGGLWGVRSVRFNFSKMDFRYQQQNELILGPGDDTVTVTPSPVPLSINGGAGLDRCFVDDGGYAFSEVGNEVRVATKAPVTLSNFDAPTEHGPIIRGDAARLALEALGVVFDVSVVLSPQRVQQTVAVTNSGALPVVNLTIEPVGHSVTSPRDSSSGIPTGRRIFQPFASPGVIVSVSEEPTGATLEEIVAGMPASSAKVQFKGQADPGGGMTASLLMPALTKVKEKANRTRCANNLRIACQVGSTQYEFIIADESSRVTTTPNEVLTIDAATGQTPTDAGSTLVGASADGAVVLASSRSKQLAPDGNPQFLTHLYVNGLMVDVTADGKSGDGNAGTATIDASGQFVAFASTATNLSILPDTNGGNDIFLRSMRKEKIDFDRLRRVSTGIDAVGQPTGANDVSRRPLMCADGSCVIFESKATNLVQGISDTNNDWDVFRYDVATGVVTCLSLDATGTSTGDAGTNLQAVSADGSRVVWFTTATTITLPPASGDTLVVSDKASPQLFLACAKGSSASARAYISGDGSSVVFTINDDFSAQTGVPDLNAVSDLHHWDLGTNKVSLLSARFDGSSSGTGATPAVDGDRVAISFDGQIVVCATDADDLIAGASSRGVGSWDLATNKKARLAQTSTSGGGVSAPTLPSLSSDGGTVLWQSFVDEQNPGSPPLNFTQVWSKHIASGQVDMITGKHVPGNPLYEAGSQGGTNPLYAKDRVLFTSSSTNLAAGDATDFPDVFATINHVSLVDFAPTGADNEFELVVEQGELRLKDTLKTQVRAARPPEATDFVFAYGSETDADTLVLNTESGLTSVRGGIGFYGGRIASVDSFTWKCARTIQIATGDLDGDGIPDIVASQPGLFLTGLHVEVCDANGDIDDADMEVKRVFVLPHVLEKTGSISRITIEPVSDKLAVYSSATGGISATFSEALTSTSVTFTEFGPGLSVDVDFTTTYVRRKDMLQWYCDASKVTHPVIVFGGACDDTITGGKGADHIDGGGGTDSLDGGAGVDTYALRGRQNGAVVCADYDYVELSRMEGGASIDLSSSLSQTIAPDTKIQFSQPPGVFEGSDYSDTVHWSLEVRPIRIEMKREAGGSPGGDTLVLDAGGQVATDLGGKVVSPGKGTVTFDGVETLTILNNAPSPQVAFFQVNDGSKQRARVVSLTVAFNGGVTFTGSPSAAFELKRTDGLVIPCDVSLADNNGFTTATLTFSGAGIVGGSIPDGRYTLTVLSSEVTGGLVGGDAPFSLHRLIGDVDGDADVDAQDFGAFRQNFGTSNFAFDFDGDGDVDAADFGLFRLRFGTSV